MNSSSENLKNQLIYGKFILPTKSIVKESKENNSTNQDSIDIIIYTDAKLYKPIRFIGESAQEVDEFEVARFNIKVKGTKTECILHIRNKLGASKQNTLCNHYATLKIKSKGIDNKDGIPIAIDSATVDDNVDKKIASKITRDYSEIFEFVGDNKDTLLTI